MGLGFVSSLTRFLLGWTETMTNPSAKQTRAFTLIELLVVVAIISLLVSILLPSLTKAKNLAKRAVCASNWHSVGLIAAMYQSDYGGAMPDHFTSGGNVSSLPIYCHATAQMVGFGRFREYVDHQGDWPGNGGWLDWIVEDIPGEIDSADMSRRGIFSCPDSLLTHWLGDAANVEYLLPYTAEGVNWPPQESDPWPWPPMDVGTPADVTVGACCIERSGNSNPFSPSCVVQSYAHDREGLNILRFDGHVLWRDEEVLIDRTVSYGNPAVFYSSAVNN